MSCGEGAAVGDRATATTATTTTTSSASDIKPIETTTVGCRLSPCSSVHNMSNGTQLQQQQQSYHQTGCVSRADSVRSSTSVKSCTGERLRDGGGYRLRAAGICTRRSEDGTLVQLLLVSGLKCSSQLVVPGGGMEFGERAEDTAARELEEEAGVRAVPLRLIIHFQDDEKKQKTSLYEMSAQHELSSWLDGERCGRTRHWLAPDEARRLLKPAHQPLLDQLLSLPPLSPSPNSPHASSANHITSS